MSRLSNEDVEYEYNKAFAKEGIKSQARAAYRGWIYRILPAGILIIAITLGGVQMATGVPVQDVFTGSKIDDAAHKKVLAARIIVGVVLFVVVTWLYKTYRDSGKTMSGFLLGGELATNVITNTMTVGRTQLYQDAASSSKFLEEAGDQQDRYWSRKKSMALAQMGLPPSTQPAAPPRQAAPATPVVPGVAVAPGGAMAQGGVGGHAPVIPLAPPGAFAGGGLSATHI
jgi:hypothetical protein